MQEFSTVKGSSSAKAVLTARIPIVTAHALSADRLGWCPAANQSTVFLLFENLGSLMACASDGIEVGGELCAVNFVHDVIL